MSHIQCHVACTSYTPCCYCLTLGLIEVPMNTTAEIGQLVTFTCTYRLPEPQPNNTFISIIFFNLPPINTFIHIRSTDGVKWVGTLSFSTTSAFPTVSNGYQCHVSMSKVTLAITEPVTLTISCKFTT